jgi:hypothetical protein
MPQAMAAPKFAASRHWSGKGPGFPRHARPAALGPRSEEACGAAVRFLHRQLWRCRRPCYDLAREPGGHVNEMDYDG